MTNSSKLLRITQINAAYFDREILNILTEHVLNLLKNLPPGFLSKVHPELKASIKFLIVYYSVIKCNRTFGQKLLLIQYVRLNNLKKFLYILTHFYDYAQERLEFWKHYDNIKFIFTFLNGLLIIGRFVNISLFLMKGQYPNLNERLLGLKQEYVHDNAQRLYDTKYMTRELLWNGLIEILVYILPLINYHKLLRIFKNLNPFHENVVHKFVENPKIYSNTLCTHCRMKPIYPHHMGCNHIFCYSCLKGNQLADVKYECPVCGTSSPNGLCKRVNP